MNNTLPGFLNRFSSRLLGLVLLLSFFSGGLETQAQDYSPYVYAVTNTPGLLGYWRFDSNFLFNSYVNGYTGTSIGYTGTNDVDGVVIGGPGSGAPLAGDLANQSAMFNGSNYISTDLWGGMGNEYTLMAWLNIAAFPGSTNPSGGTYDGYAEIIDQQQFANDCDIILFPTGQIYFYTDSGGCDEVNTINGLGLNSWHFVVGTFIGSGPRKIYVDGLLMGENLAGAAGDCDGFVGNHFVNNVFPLWFGYSPIFTPRHFVGSIDEGACFSRALTGAEIAAIYLASGPTNIGTLASLSMSVPAGMPVGATLQATVQGQFSLGTNYDLTDVASYASSATNVLTVNSKGLVTALQAGSATVTATYNAFVASQTITVVPPGATLTHRYSFFTGTANDAVGTANGILKGTASLAGSALTLDGNGYVQLPAGTISSNYYAVSIEMWANLQRTADATVNVVTSFGDSTGDYLRLGTHDGNGDGNAWIGDFTSNSVFGGYEDVAFKPGPVVGNVHLVGVWDATAQQMSFYVDGYPANSASIASLGGTNAINIIGANIDGTEGVVGTIEEYRIYDGALTLDQIRASLAAGPTNAPLVNNQITAGSITNVTVTTHSNFIVGTILDPVVLASSATVQNIKLTTLASVAFGSSDSSVLAILPDNQIQAVGVGTATLTATYQGVSGQILVATMPAPGLMLTHRYSFLSDASDSVSGENGVLKGNATINGGLNINQEGDGNGFGDYLWLPRDLVSGYPALTVEAWVNLPTQTGPYCRIFSTGTTSQPGGDADDIVLSPDYNGYIDLNDTSNNINAGPADQLAVPADVPSSTVNVQGAGLIQLVGVFDPDNHIGSLYYNGQLVGAAGFEYPLTGINMQYAVVGKSGHVDDPFLVGNVVDLRFYFGAITPGQVASNYAAGVTNVAVNSGAAQISDPPLAQTVISGTPLILSAGVIGAPPISYQWLLGGSPISGATDSSYIVPSATSGNAGIYALQVSNSLSGGTPATSQGVQVTVTGSANLTNDLLVHLTFDDTYSDSSGNTNDASPGGSPTFIPGKIGQAIHLLTAPPIFNYVFITNSTAWSYASNFSVAFWQRHTGRINDLPMAGNAVNSTYNPGWVLTADEGPDYSEGRLETTLDGAGFIAMDPAPGPVINDGLWHHCALVINRDIQQAQLFVDGNEVYSQPMETDGTILLGDLTDPNINTLTIGSDPTGTYGVAGQYDIDDFALWMRPLAPDEIQTIYTLGQSGVTFTGGVVPQTLSVQKTANGATISWSAGTLQSAPTLLGPWNPVPGAAAPSYQFVPSGPTNVFFRVVQQ
jgi:Concanavalin A-like lectin/glucanases superfamily/Bacterial Ig-like domain (group 2)